MENDNTRPGWATSEFWLAVLVITAATVLRVTHDIDPGAWQWAVSTSTAAYAASRALVKRAEVSGEAVLSSFKADLVQLAAAEDKPRRPRTGS